VRVKEPKKNPEVASDDYDTDSEEETAKPTKKPARLENFKKQVQEQQEQKYKKV
jgi:hypothetical protein